MNVFYIEKPQGVLREYGPPLFDYAAHIDKRKLSEKAVEAPVETRTAIDPAVPSNNVEIVANSKFIGVSKVISNREQRANSEVKRTKVEKTTTEPKEKEASDDKIDIKVPITKLKLELPKL